MKQKTFKNRNKFRNFLLFSFLLLLGGNLQAQPPLKAGFVNNFTLPNKIDTINVLMQSELGSCNITGITVNLLSSAAAPGTLQHGTAVLSTDGNKNIIYTPAAGFVGQDSLKYTITCGVNTSNTGLVLINVDNKPDVIRDEACAVTPPAMVWGIQIDWKSAKTNVSFLVNPMVGDMDGDGIPEIVCFSNISESGIPTADTGPSVGLRTVYVYDGKSKALKDSITLVHGISNYEATPYGLVKLPDGRALFVVLSWDRILRAYQTDGSVASLTSNTPVWTATDVISTNPKDIGVNLFFTDFNHDGWPEICVRNKIYDAATGKLLKTASGGSNVGASWAHFSHSTGRTLSSPIAADVMGDANLELILGNEIYSVNIQSRTDTTQNSITRIAYHAPPANLAGYPAIPNDGHAQVADFNGDGHLDILITLRNVAPSAGGTTSGYVWDVYNGTVSTPFQITTKMSGKSFPLITDMDNDGLLEIAIMTAVNEDTDYIRCYKYNPSSRTFSLFWKLHPDEDSYSNAMTAFDFNQDGLLELLITDQKEVRIFNGSGKSHITGNDTLNIYQLAAFPFVETTIMQIPVIADVDDDGSAEVLFCSGNTVNTLRSIDPNSPWAPARGVWNQYVYNPIYVNEDLTIPPYPLNPATKFVDKDGNYLQPFNNSLQQATLLNREGKMLSYGSDLIFDLDVPIVYSNYTGSTVDVTFNVENTGDADFSDALDISAYALQAGAFTKVQTYILNITIPAGTSVPISYTITGLPAGIDPANVMQIRINESDNNFLVPECNYSGNFSKALFGSPDYALCPGEHKIDFYPGNSGYLYVWYNSDPTKTPKPAPVESGDSHTFIKSPSKLVEKFYVEVYDGPSLMDVYPVTTYLVPDSLTWMGTISSDWNDYRNWNYPNNPQPAVVNVDTVKYQIPGECTNVLIPSSRSIYPNLSAFANDIRSNATCNNIYFAFGGEVARTDTLNYNQAFVDLTLNTHQYYMIAPSLKNMYTGDYYITQPNPWLDDRLYEPMFFNVPNPQTLKTAVT
ncbi:MAG: FG-GAP-like repeat-containing protein, partial [Dysgonamonadaceae bacterium]|nr:FG-GAP-like repeat-containing protein [Dysgonamonadaceae bacterium]